jgi:protoporphyrinogen oxidase
MVNRRVAILGGGLSGLTAANSLLQNGFDVILFEKSEYVGGLASNFEFNRDYIPKFYHHIVESNKNTLRYLAKYNCLSSKEDWKRVQISIGWDGNVASINKLAGLLKFNYLNFYEKLKFALFGLKVLYLLNPDKLDENLGAKDWLVKYGGKSIANKIFSELYGRNKFNVDLNDISARQFANRLKEREVLDKFMFPKKGVQGMIDGLKNDIFNKKGDVVFNADIIRVDLKNKNISLADGKMYKFDILVNTIPIPEFLKISEGFPKTYVDKIKKVRYCPVIGLVFGTENFLKKGVYWFNLLQERVHVIIQHSVLADKYNDKINWCVRYGGSEADWKLSDDEIKNIYMKDVTKYFSNADVKWIKVFKEKYGEPIYDVNYLRYKPDYRTPLNYVYMAGIQVTCPKIRNMDVALESGELVANIIIDDHLS